MNSLLSRTFRLQHLLPAFRRTVVRHGADAQQTTLKLGLRQLCSDERGLSTVEYIVLLGFIVVGAVSTWKHIGSDVQDALGEAEKDISQLQEVKSK